MPDPVMTIAASQPASGVATVVTVRAFLRENLAVRGYYVRECTAAGNLEVASGARLRSRMIIATNGTGNRKYYAAAKDIHGVWSELSPVKQFTGSNFVSGSTVASVGSGSSRSELVEEANLLFPDFNLTSGQMTITKAIISEGFLDETARQKYEVTRQAFKIVMNNIDEEETLLLHSFFKQVNGPLLPFYFDFPDRITDKVKRYVVRFRDSTLGDELFTVDRSNVSFTLIELVGTSAIVDV